MKQDKRVTIRLPVDLYYLCLAAEPNKTISEIVRTALDKFYGFSEIKDISVDELAEKTKLIFTDDDERKLNDLLKSFSSDF